LADIDLVHDAIKELVKATLKHIKSTIPEYTVVPLSQLPQRVELDAVRTMRRLEAPDRYRRRRTVN
jgi:hypothetical protein